MSHTPRWIFGCVLSGLITGVVAAERSPDLIDFGCVVDKEFEEQRGQRRVEIASFRAQCDVLAEEQGYLHGFVRPAVRNQRLPAVCLPEDNAFVCCGAPGTEAGGIEGLKC